MNGNVTKEGITADLEAMHALGLGGVQIFDAGCNIPAGAVDFNSPAWFDVIRHAAAEARRLGMEICLPNCSGWSSSGGPWNSATNAMKWVVSTETPVKGGTTFTGRLRQPEDKYGFYEDIAVFAVKASGPAIRTVRNEEANQLAASRQGLVDVAALTFRNRGPERGARTAKVTTTVLGADDRVDLTRQMAADGSLTWTAPAGADWRILRIGYAANGRCNHPASDHGRGFEVDKLSAAAMDHHFEAYVAKLCQYLGPLAGHVPSGLNNILVDSYEVGSQNWTQGFAQTFEKRKGYSILPYMPVFAGYIVGSVEETTRVLWDFRRVVADLFAENYAAALAKKCHEYGLQLSLEAYGNGPHDDLQYGRWADVPMAEFWSQTKRGSFAGNAGNAKQPASLAHVWGRTYVATESFTANPVNGGCWTTTPFAIKAQGDEVYAKGVNRIIYHRFTHQPWAGDQYLPGMTMGKWGMHLDRTQTWWDDGKAWIAYQTRCQYLLQQGTFVADALFWCGEDAPNVGSVGSLPQGYDWDWCDTDALRALTVADGRLVAPGGTTYRFLVLPSVDMTPEALKVLTKLADAGATLVGPRKPVKSPGFAGYPACDQDVQTLADRLWAKPNVLACTPAEALAKLQMPADAICREPELRGRFSAIHRRVDDAELYFVALRNPTSTTFTVSFRQQGRVPELWDAETGAIGPAPLWREADGRTEVTLAFKPSGSSFVVFRRPAAGDHAVAVDAQVLRHPEPAVPAVKHTLVITKAEYGYYPEAHRNGMVNVTDLVAAAIRSAGQIKVSNQTLGGDPCANVPKSLSVEYVADGQTRTENVKEFTFFKAPKHARIAWAWYGDLDPAWRPGERKVLDITAKVQAAVKDGTLKVVVDNALAGKDPIYRQVKEAHVDYVYDGRARSVVVPEHRTLVLPADKPEVLDGVPDYEVASDGAQGIRLQAWQPLTATVRLASGATRTLRAAPAAPVRVTGPWDVSFQEKRGAPAKAVFPELISWPAHAEPGIKYFSGSAVYQKELAVTRPADGARVILDLGDVKNFATVTVNGRTYPALWKPPFRVDITDALTDRPAALAVKVTNLWPNRLIGDEQLPDDCEWKKADYGEAIVDIPAWVKAGKPSPTGRITFTTWKHWHKTDELLPSGLLGPVILRTVVEAK